MWFYEIETDGQTMQKPPDKLAGMKSTIGRFDIQWLLMPITQTATPVDEHLAVQRVDFPIPAELGTSWMESLQLGEGFVLHRAVHHLEKAPFGQLIPVLEVTLNEPQPFFSAQTCLSGITCYQEYWQGRSAPPVELWARPGQCTFRLSRDWDVRILIAGGGLTEMRSVMLAQPMLQFLLGDGFETELMARLGLVNSIKGVTRQMPLHLNAPLQEAMSDRYAGPARRLFAQAKALEYLGLIVDFFQTEIKVAPERRHKQKIRELKDYLLSSNGRVPTLSRLATEFGLSAKRLNIEFKAEFGQSIFEYVTTNRLEQAHDALLESSVPMKVLSDRLGYSHVNHFITAFKSRFGYPPGKLRKASQSASAATGI
jgi:AraC-like DNA-binding protein